MKGKQPGKRIKAKIDRGHTTTEAILGTHLAGRPGSGKPRIPTRWTKHYDRLLALRARLEQDRADHALAACQPLEPYSMDMADAATDEFDHSLSLAALSTEQDALYEVEEALKRILAGTYGICQLTGKRIPEKRLAALPWTRFGSDAERQLELEGQANRPHLGDLRSVAGSPASNLEPVEPEEVLPEMPPSDEALSRVVPSPGLDLSRRSKGKGA